jgi:hypothetical protein
MSSSASNASGRICCCRPNPKSGSSSALRALRMTPFLSPPTLASEPLTVCRQPSSPQTLSVKLAESKPGNSVRSKLSALKGT